LQVHSLWLGKSWHNIDSIGNQFWVHITSLDHTNYTILKHYVYWVTTITPILSIHCFNIYNIILLTNDYRYQGIICKYIPGFTQIYNFTIHIYFAKQSCLFLAKNIVSRTLFGVNVFIQNIIWSQLYLSKHKT